MVSKTLLYYQIASFYLHTAQFDVRGIGHSTYIEAVVEEWADAWVERGIDYFLIMYFQ